jgi:hypothetical protein
MMRRDNFSRSLDLDHGSNAGPADNSFQEHERKATAMEWMNALIAVTLTAAPVTVVLGILYSIYQNFKQGSAVRAAIERRNRDPRSGP